jgi:hypothetical protein
VDDVVTTGTTLMTRAFLNGRRSSEDGQNIGTQALLDQLFAQPSGGPDRNRLGQAGTWHWNEHWVALKCRPHCVAVESECTLDRQG